MEARDFSDSAPASFELFPENLTPIPYQLWQIF